MTKSLKELVEAANAVVPKVTPEQAQQMIADGALVVDVREPAEVEQSGKVAGAVHVSRGMLEFRADPDFLHAKAESEKQGLVISSTESTFLRLADFSPKP